MITTNQQTPIERMKAACARMRALNNEAARRAGGAK